MLKSLTKIGLVVLAYFVFLLSASFTVTTQYNKSSGTYIVFDFQNKNCSIVKNSLCSVDSIENFSKVPCNLPQNPSVKVTVEYSIPLYNEYYYLKSAFSV